MRIRVLMGILLIILCILTLNGCQLAQIDAGEGVTGDRLIGVLVTGEHLDLFDFEGYIGDNLGKIIAGKDIHIDRRQEQYDGRLYAVLKEQEFTHEDTGEKIKTKEYIFEDIEGISYFSARVPETDHSDSYFTIGSGEGISDGHTGIFIGDDEDRTTLEGTIYVASNEGAVTYYINPVYQSADGSVYAMSGSGISMSGDQGEGGSFSQTLEETSTIVEDGKSKEVATSAKITIELMLPPEKIVILQMDENNGILLDREYLPGDVPDNLIPEIDTAYIIVETHKRDNAGITSVMRELFSREDESLWTFSCRDDGVCIKGYTQLVWE